MKDLFVEAVKSIGEVFKTFLSEVLRHIYGLKNRQ